MPGVVDRTFQTRLDCHYLLQVPDDVDDRTTLAVTLHGFGAKPEVMLELTARLFTKAPVIASVEGPYRFFLDRQAQDAGCGWTTNRRPAESIRLHHDIVSHVLQDAGEEAGIPRDRRILVGFSQPVALNYRFAATFPDEVRGVIGVCGGLPGNWETGDYERVTASILHIARRADEYYSPAMTQHYEERLRLRADDVEFHLIEGGHTIPSNAQPIVDPWLDRVLR